MPKTNKIICTTTGGGSTGLSPEFVPPSAETEAVNAQAKNAIISNFLINVSSSPQSPKSMLILTHQARKESYEINNLMKVSLRDALRFCLKGLEREAGDTDAQAFWMLYVAMCQREMGDPIAALCSHLSVEPYLWKVEPKRLAFSHCHGRAQCYHKLREFDKAMTLFRIAAQGHGKLGEQSLQASAFNCMALVLKDQKRYGEAHQVVNDAILIWHNVGEIANALEGLDTKRLIFEAEGRA